MVIYLCHKMIAVHLISPVLYYIGHAVYIFILVCFMGNGKFCLQKKIFIFLFSSQLQTSHRWTAHVPWILLISLSLPAI